MEPTFRSIRKEFAKAVFSIRSSIAKSQPCIQDVKNLLYSFPDLKPELVTAKTMDDILNLVHDKCTVIDISYLEAIVEQFNIEEAKKSIKAYKDIVEKFSQDVTLELCLDESFPVAKIPSPLKYETAKFVLDWDPANNYTINDIRNILAVSFKKLSKRVKIVVIKKDNSIAVICTFPLHLLGPLIVIAQETIELVKKRGLIRLSVGPFIIWDIKSRDQVYINSY